LTPKVGREWEKKPKNKINNNNNKSIATCFSWVIEKENSKVF
jgi:hypothetical protein